MLVWERGYLDVVCIRMVLDRKLLTTIREIKGKSRCNGRIVMRSNHSPPLSTLLPSGLHSPLPPHIHKKKKKKPKTLIVYSNKLWDLWKLEWKPTRSFWLLWALKWGAFQIFFFPLPHPKSIVFPTILFYQGWTPWQSWFFQHWVLKIG